MRFGAKFALVAIFAAQPCFAQSADSETLKDILSEMRSLHNDVRLGQTTQILLTELEVQQTAVTRAMQKRDDSKTKLSQVQSNQKNITTQLSQFEDRANNTTDSTQKKQLEQARDNFAATLASLKQQEQDDNNDLAQAENALRKEQDTLQSIQDRLDEVVRKLQPVNSQ